MVERCSNPGGLSQVMGGVAWLPPATPLRGVPGKQKGPRIIDTRPPRLD